MQADNKHFKFINSQTGNAIYYCAINPRLNETEAKKELDKVKAQVAIKNALFTGAIYWEEVRDNK